MTTVVRIRRKGGNIAQGCDIYIGRRCTQGGWDLQDSKWHNPFSVNQYGREQCLNLYRSYIMKKIEENPILYNLHELKDKILGCWCKPDRCHGDILVDIMKEKGL